MVTDSKGTEELISFIILPMSQRYLKARFKVKDNVLKHVLPIMFFKLLLTHLCASYVKISPIFTSPSANKIYIDI